MAEVLVCCLTECGVLYDCVATTCQVFANCCSKNTSIKKEAQILKQQPGRELMPKPQYIKLNAQYKAGIT